jgi:hypothetical protein
MKIGTAQIDITPEPGIELCGFAKREQPSDRVLDKLFARVLLIEQDYERVLLINLDLIGLESEFVGKVRNRLCEILKIPENNIQLFATHTHSGPGTIHLNYCGEYNPEYLDELEEKIMAGCRTALGKPITCTTGYAEDLLELGVNRRNGHTLPLPLKALYWKTLDGSCLAVLVNYPMHPVCLKTSGISADYTGILNSVLTKIIPGNPIVLFSLGAAGDIDPPGVGVEYQDMIKWGKSLSSASGSLVISGGSLSHKELKINVKRISTKVKLNFLKKEGIDRYADKYLNKISWDAEFGENYRQAVKKWRSDMKDAVSKGLGKDSRIDISVLEIGVIKLILVNAELFSEFERILRDKMNSPFMVISCANGMKGYFPGEQEYDRGGYEIETSIFFYNSFLPVKGSLEKIADEIIEFSRDPNGYK